MKRQFKLIKTYPGSPILNSIAVLSDREDYIIEGFGYLPKGIIEANAKYWKEIFDYEIICRKLGRNLIYDEIFFPISNDYKIYKVRRLSDNAIFTVGDIVKDNEKNTVFQIGSIEMNSDKSLLFTNCDIAYYSSLESISLFSREPLFKTEDGVEIFEGDKYFVIDPSFIVLEKKASKFSSICKCFLTKEKAEEYRNKLLIEEAEKRYPKGTKFKSAVNSSTFISSGQFMKNPHVFSTIITDVNNGAVWSEGKWAEVVKEKTLEDYEKELLERKDIYEIGEVPFYDSNFYMHLKSREPKFYWTKILQLIADDLNEGWDWRKEKNDKDLYSILYSRPSNEYIPDKWVSANSGNVFLKNIELTQKAIDIMGDKLDYIYK